MTYARREEIFSKEYLSIADLQELLGLDYQVSARLMRQIKRKLELDGQGVRLNIQGKLFIQDYLDYFKITNVERYKKLIEKE